MPSRLITSKLTGPDLEDYYPTPPEDPEDEGTVEDDLAYILEENGVKWDQLPENMKRGIRKALETQGAGEVASAILKALNKKETFAIRRNPFKQ